MKVTAEAHVVIPFFPYRAEPIQDPFAVSVALHADTGRLNRALHVIHRWNGPVSLSVLLTSQDDINVLIAFVLQNESLLLQVDFHIHMEQPGRDTNIESLTTKIPNPVDREEAKYMWDAGIMEPFHLQKFKWGHQMTKFGQWYHWTIHRETIPESFFPTEYEPGFEPYFLGYKNQTTILPEYWPDFRGFGYNKYVYFLEADQMGFQFGVLSDFFVVHLPHHNPPKRRMSEETIQEVERFSEYLMKTYNMTENQVYNSPSIDQFFRGPHHA
eukprot:Nitzschia sp. Nitz4//scaffold49_size126201//61333//62142//NITZ4_003643-RA/size126201-processed-gene-0.97-mRNA-1//-1//CDS//3329553152//7583//frame0